MWLPNNTNFLSCSPRCDFLWPFISREGKNVGMRLFVLLLTIRGVIRFLKESFVLLIIPFERKPILRGIFLCMVAIFHYSFCFMSQVKLRVFTFKDMKEAFLAIISSGILEKTGHFYKMSKRAIIVVVIFTILSHELQWWEINSFWSAGRFHWFKHFFAVLRIETAALPTDSPNNMLSSAVKQAGGTFLAELNQFSQAKHFEICISSQAYFVNPCKSRF